MTGEVRDKLMAIIALQCVGVGALAMSKSIFILGLPVILFIIPHINASSLFKKLDDSAALHMKEIKRTFIELHLFNILWVYVGLYAMLGDDLFTSPGGMITALWHISALAYVFAVFGTIGKKVNAYKKALYEKSSSDAPLRDGVSSVEKLVVKSPTTNPATDKCKDKELRKEDLYWWPMVVALWVYSGIAFAWGGEELKEVNIGILFVCIFVAHTAICYGMFKKLPLDKLKQANLYQILFLLLGGYLALPIFFGGQGVQRILEMMPERGINFIFGISLSSLFPAFYLGLFLVTQGALRLVIWHQTVYSIEKRAVE